ncbi:hypothetical protein C8R44DRAFT_886931 [Mycena epipterygia]|nr:hypothetical protein C8R44DRAFT_886931 [Mycena epipterygia]
MPSRTKSARVKAHANSCKKELNLQAAVYEYEREQPKLGKKPVLPVEDDEDDLEEEQIDDADV